MSNTTGMPEVDPQMPNAMSVYGQDGALEDFPVLKAFQQYVDAEQAKAQKRMTGLCIFFITLMVGIVAVFVLLLMNISARNQALNDRMIELAMNRNNNAVPASSPVVVQPPQDSAAILALTDKMDALQKKLAEDQAKAERAAKEAAEKAEKAAKEAAEKAEKAAIEAAKPKGPTAEELEIKRLKALLSAEKEKNSLEKERLRQAELEAYRRKHYPEYYAPKTQVPKDRYEDEIIDDVEDEEADDIDIDQLIDEVKALRKKRDESPSQPNKKKQAQKKAQPPKALPPASAEKEYSIPVDVQGSSMNWNIPDED